MRISIFSDLHGDVSALEQLLNEDADFYFSAGDLSTFGRGLDRMGSVLRKKADRVYSLPGSHESEAVHEKFCAQFGLHNFHGKTVGIAGYYICGLGCSNVSVYRTTGEYTEEDFESKLDVWAHRKPLILICHCPPKNTQLDVAPPDKHLGSVAVRTFIEKRQPEYFFCGQVHESEGNTDLIGATKAFNVGKQGYVLSL